MDRFGRPLVSGDTDVQVWAGRFDRRSTQRGQDGVLVEKSFSTYTIRERAGVSESTIVVDGGVSYSVIGAPRRRGGIGDGRVQRYLELDCVRVG